MNENLDYPLYTVKHYYGYVLAYVIIPVALIIAAAIFLLKTNSFTWISFALYSFLPLAMIISEIYYNVKLTVYHDRLELSYLLFFGKKIFHFTDMKSIHLKEPVTLTAHPKNILLTIRTTNKKSIIRSHNITAQEIRNIKNFLESKNISVKAELR